MLSYIESCELLEIFDIKMKCIICWEKYLEVVYFVDWDKMK